MVKESERLMDSDGRRVVITGIGLISPLGNSKEALWDALASGTSGVRKIDAEPDCPLPVKFAAAARGFSGSIDDFGELDKQRKKAIRKGLKVMCRECQMGVAAAQLALADSRLGDSDLDPLRTGVSFATDYMLSVPEEFNEAISQCLDSEGRFDFERWGHDGLAKMSPLWLLKYLPNMPASHVAIYNDIRGPNNSLTLREAGSNAAIGEAFEIIRRGSAEVMLAGATGTRLHPMKMVHAIQQEELADDSLPPESACRPFDKDRTGAVLGEGAGVVVLEELSAAEARGATIYGEVTGAASASALDRNFLAHRDKALTNVIRSSMRKAGAQPADIGHIHAHGLATHTSDREEAKAIVDCLADTAEPIPVVAAKSYFGNLGAGSGAVELIASLLAMQQGTLFPVLNYRTPDPECPIAVVAGSQVSPGGSVLSLSVTPQGQAAAVLVRTMG